MSLCNLALVILAISLQEFPNNFKSTSHHVIFLFRCFDINARKTQLLLFQSVKDIIGNDACNSEFYFLSKKKIFKKIVWIQSHHLTPSVKIQIMGGKGVKAKHCWMLSTNFWIQKFVDNIQQCFAYTPFLPMNLNFHWRCKVMGSNPGYLLIFFTLNPIILSLNH